MRVLWGTFSDPLTLEAVIAQGTLDVVAGDSSATLDAGVWILIRLRETGETALDEDGLFFVYREETGQ